MGHITLISEEIMKLFFNNPRDVCANIPTTAFDRSKWETYIEGSFRETRERDSQALGGGVSMAAQSAVSVNPGEGSAEGYNSGKSRNLFSASDEQSDAGTSPDKAHVSCRVFKVLSRVILRPLCTVRPISAIRAVERDRRWSRHARPTFFVKLIIVI